MTTDVGNRLARWSREELGVSEPAVIAVANMLAIGPALVATRSKPARLLRTQLMGTAGPPKVSPSPPGRCRR